MPTNFDTASIVRSLKLTEDEAKTVSVTVERLQFLNNLIEKLRPTNAEARRKKADEALEIMLGNPNELTVANFQAALGNTVNADVLFGPTSDYLNQIADKDSAALIPVAQRIHGEALEIVKDAKKFGLATIEKIADIGEKGAALVEFSAAHKQAVSDFEAEASVIPTKRGALNWLSRYGYVESPYDH